MDNKLTAPLGTLQWVPREWLKPNDYNPNKVSKENLKLLTQSILTNGWTLPIVHDYRRFPQVDRGGRRSADVYA